MLGMLPEQVRWIESVVQAIVGKWTGWPGKEQSVMGGGAKACIAEVRGRWPIQIERFVEMEWERGRSSYQRANEGVEWVRVTYMYC